MNQATFEQAFPGLLRAAYRSALRIVGDVGVAEDVSAEALTRAMMRWRHVGPRARPWVVHVATNLAIDHIRHQNRARRWSTDIRLASITTSEVVAAQLDLHRALASLPRRQREVVVLRYFGDLSEREIADQLGLAPGTVKSHASRGLAALRSVLTEAPPAPTSEVARWT